MAVEKAPVWTFPTNPKRLGRWYGKGPADRSPVGSGPAAARRASSAMVPVQRSAGRGTWKRTASCERKTDRSATRRTVPSVSGAHVGSRTRAMPFPLPGSGRPRRSMGDAPHGAWRQLMGVMPTRWLPLPLQVCSHWPPSVGASTLVLLLFAPVDPVASFRRLSKEFFKESDGSVRRGKGWPAGSDLIGIRSATPSWFPWCAGKGFPRRAPAGSRTRRRQRRKQNDGTGGGLDASGKGRNRSGRARGPVRRIMGGRSAAGPGSGSSDHSWEPLVSAEAIAARRRDAISRPAPPPTATSAARTIGTMPAPVMASGLGR